MPFDLATAKPAGGSPGGGFDISSAKPVDETAAQRADRKLTGYGEAALSMLTSATSGLVGRVGGTVGGIAADVATGKYGTKEGAEMAAQTAEEGARKFTFEPKSQEGKDALEAIGRFFEGTKLSGLGPAESVALTATVGPTAQAAREVTRDVARPAVGHAARVVRQGARDIAADMRAPEAEMAGMGAANTEQETLRRTRAESLPVPIRLTKGQASRDFAQQQFEREAAKNPKTGEPLRQRYAEQNEKILQNFDAWIDQTGAESGSLRATGEAVSEAIVNKSNKAKTEIRAAYKAAEDSGAMQERVDAAPLQKYLDEHQAEAINAPVLTSVEARLQRMSKDGSLSVHDLEEVRKMVGRLSGKDATNALFGKEVKTLIDGMTEGKGGELYKKARALRFRYGQEFEQHGVVNKLLSFKPGTQDRAVAYEDVFSHSILKGSLDDVRVMRRTLQTAGPEGEKAWRELQGSTLQHIKDEITKNVQVDQAGNRVLSPARLDKLVTELDKDGKLDFIFGKQGAQQIRDVNGIALDAFTAPPNAINHSNSVSVLLTVLDKVASKVTGVPMLGAATNWTAKEWRNAGERSKVRKALE